MTSETLERLDVLEALRTLVQRVEYYAPQHADICDEAKEAIRQAEASR